MKHTGMKVKIDGLSAFHQGDKDLKISFVDLVLCGGVYA